MRAYIVHDTCEENMMQTTYMLSVKTHQIKAYIAKKRKVRNKPEMKSLRSVLKSGQVNNNLKSYWKS